MTFFQIEKCIILYIAVLITLRIKWIFSLTVYMYMYEAPSLHFQTAKNSIKNHPSTKCKQAAHSKRLGNLCSLPQEHIQKISEKSSGTFASSTPLMFGFPIIF